MNNNNVKQRILWADTAKGIGILAVIIGHLGISWINRMVFSWHMPLFFIISGMFLSTKLNVGEFCKKKVHTLLIPFIVTSFALMITNGLVELYNQGVHAAILRMLKTTISAIGGSGGPRVLGKIEFIGAIWFLEALFWALITVRILIPNKHKYTIMLVLFIVAWLSPKLTWLPFNIQSGLFAVPFVYYGYAYLKRINQSRIYSYSMAIVGCFAWFLIGFYQKRVMAMVCNFARPWDLIAAPFIVQSVIVLSKIILRFNILNSILQWFGRNSLTILCCHLFELNEIPWHSFYSSLGIKVNNGYLLLALLILSKVIFVTISTFIINYVKIKFLQKTLIKY